MKNSFITIISYAELQDIIIEFFKEVEKMEIEGDSYIYFRNILTYKENHPNIIDKSFIMYNKLGATRFDVPKEDIYKILSMHLEEQNFELLDVQYCDNSVGVKYKIKGQRHEFSIIKDEDDTMVESVGKSR